MNLPDDPAIADKLSACYGFNFPAAFAPLVRLALEAAAEEDYVDEYAFLSYYGFRFEFDSKVVCVLANLLDDEDRQMDASGRYLHTPPEFFPFGWLGMDG